MSRALVFALVLSGCASTRFVDHPHDTVRGEWTVTYLHGTKNQWARAHDLGSASLREGGKAVLRLCERTRLAEYDVYCDALSTCVDATWAMDGKRLVLKAGDKTWQGEVNYVGASFVWFAQLWGPQMEAATFSPSETPISCEVAPQ